MSRVQRRSPRARSPGFVSRPLARLTSEKPNGRRVDHEDESRIHRTGSSVAGGVRAPSHPFLFRDCARDSCSSMCTGTPAGTL